MKVELKVISGLLLSRGVSRPPLWDLVVQDLRAVVDCAEILLYRKALSFGSRQLCLPHHSSPLAQMPYSLKALGTTVSFLINLSKTLISDVARWWSCISLGI